MCKYVRLDRLLLNACDINDQYERAAKPICNAANCALTSQCYCDDVVTSPSVTKIQFAPIAFCLVKLDASTFV